MMGDRGTTERRPSLRGNRGQGKAAVPDPRTIVNLSTLVLMGIAVVMLATGVVTVAAVIEDVSLGRP